MRVGNSIKEYVLLIDMAESASITKQSKNMNYIAEINAFYDWLETNSMSTSAIVLWHALMHINNKSRWTKEFGVASSVLCVKTGLSERTIRNARNELKQKGRIEWKSRGGNKAAIYQMISLTAIDADNVADITSDTLSDNASGSTSTLNKLNNTIHSIYINGEEKFLSGNLIETLNSMLADQSYLEMMCMNYRIRDFEQMSNYLKQFFTDLSARGDNYKDEKDAKYHFANWLKSELRKEQQSYGKNKSNRTQTFRANTSTEQQESWNNSADTNTAGIEAFINTIAIG